MELSNKIVKPIAEMHLQRLQLSPPLTPPEGQSYLEYNCSSPESINSQSTNEPPKRYRTQYSPDQVASLEKEYNKDNYVTRQKRKELSEMLGLQEHKIKIWFQNRRMKDKRTKVVCPWPYASMVSSEPFMSSRVHTSMQLPSVLPQYTPYYHHYSHMPPAFALHRLPLPLPLPSSHLTHLPQYHQSFQMNMDKKPLKLEPPSHSESSCVMSYADGMVAAIKNLVHKVERKATKLFQPYKLGKRSDYLDSASTSSTN